MKRYRVIHLGKEYIIRANDITSVCTRLDTYLNSNKDERLSPMTYKKLRELGYDEKRWKNLTQEQANKIVQNSAKAQSSRSVAKNSEQAKTSGTSKNISSIKSSGSTAFKSTEEREDYMKNNGIGKYRDTTDYPVNRSALQSADIGLVREGSGQTTWGISGDNALEVLKQAGIEDGKNGAKFYYRDGKLSSIEFSYNVPIDKYGHRDRSEELQVIGGLARVSQRLADEEYMNLVDKKGKPDPNNTAPYNDKLKLRRKALMHNINEPKFRYEVFKA